KLKLCESLILFQLFYCDCVDWPALVSHYKETLQGLQNASIRLCYGLRKFDHVSFAYKRCRWLKLFLNYELHPACFIYNLNAHKSPSYLHKKLLKNTDVHNLATRGAHLYCVPKHSTSTFENSFSFNA